MKQYNLSHLQELEAESIHIIREVAAEFENPVMLYSIGKDSSVMVRLAEKAFAPGKVPFPLMHIDSKWKFKEMIQFRDEYAKKYGWNLIVESNMEAFNAGVGPFTHGSKVHTDLMKTKALLDALNTDADMPKILKVMNAFDSKWKEMRDCDRPDCLNMLLYGAPGTGKTEFAKHIARTLGRKLIIKKASDLLNCYVGETEKAIRRMFKDAEEKKAILFLDEADSLIRDRSGASRSWEVTQVNEMLTQMENFKGIFIAATNFEGELDMASRRRFALKVKFGYLKPEGVEKMWQAFFPQVEMPATARELRMLTPGDFNAAYGSLRFYDESDLTADAIINALKSEIAYKDGREVRRMGL